MLGTKHEKIVIIILAYVIGFNSGFIAFGLTQADDRTIPPIEATLDDEYSNSPDTEMTDGDQALPTELVSYTDGKLYALASGNRYVLSIDKKLVGDTVPEMLAQQGVHVSPPPFSLSPDNQFVFFCEPHDQESECLALVFDSKTNVIQYVNFEGKKLVLPADIAKSAAWTEAGLTIGTYSSASGEEPWKVVTQ